MISYSGFCSVRIHGVEWTQVTVANWSVSSMGLAASCWPVVPSLGRFAFWFLLVSICHRRILSLQLGTGYWTCQYSLPPVLLNLVLMKEKLSFINFRSAKQGPQNIVVLKKPGIRIQSIIHTYTYFKSEKMLSIRLADGANIFLPLNMILTAPLLPITATSAVGQA